MALTQKNSIPEKLTEHTQHIAWIDNVKRERNISKKLHQVQPVVQNNYLNRKIDSVGLIFNKFDDSSYQLVKQRKTPLRESRNSMPKISTTNNMTELQTIMMQSQGSMLRTIDNTARSNTKLLAYRLRMKNKPSELTMDVAIKGSRNQKNMNSDDSYRGRSQAVSSSIRVFHGNQDMKWIKSNLNRKIFNNDQSLDYDYEDPSKRIDHDSLFKKRQLTNQSYVFGEKFDTSCKFLDRRNIKKKIEGLSIDNPFLDESVDNPNHPSYNNRNLSASRIETLQQEEPIVMIGSSAEFMNRRKSQKENHIMKKNQQYSNGRISEQQIYTPGDDKRSRLRQRLLGIISSSPERSKEIYKLLSKISQHQKGKSKQQ